MSELNVYHSDTPAVPISLNGANSGAIVLTGKRRVLLQADLVTKATYRVYGRLAYTAGLAATTLATAEAKMTDAGVIELWVKPDKDYAGFYWLLTDNAGVAQNGGANDRILEMDEVHNPG